MNSVWTDHYQRPLLTVCLYSRGAEGQSKLQQRPLITNLPLCIKFGTKLIGIRIEYQLFMDSYMHKVLLMNYFITISPLLLPSTIGTCHKHCKTKEDG